MKLHSVQVQVSTLTILTTYYSLRQNLIIKKAIISVICTIKSLVANNLATRATSIDTVTPHSTITVKPPYVKLDCV